jgi:hypothetical protein
MEHIVIIGNCGVTLARHIRKNQIQNYYCIFN